MNRKKKIAASVAAVILVLALGLAGTFAKSIGDNSNGDVSGTVAFTPVLHDDFDQDGTPADPSKRDRDVFVENAGETSIYVRMRLDEYLTYGLNSLIPNAEQGKKETWTPHKPMSTNVTKCTEKFHKYFTWELGNDTTVKYTSKIHNRHKLEAGEVIADDKDTDKAKVITMAAYTKAVEENKKLDPCWIMDTDGYIYWYKPLEPGMATGLLLNQINILGTIDDSYYYGINAKMEAVTDIDLRVWIDGHKDFDEATRPAKNLLKNISPNYIRITEDMELTTPKASDYDSDRDDYLTADEYADYQKLNPTLSLKDASAFPDEKLREALSDTSIDKDGDGALTTGEREAVTDLNLSNKGISDLTGMDKFTKLQKLNVSGNHLTKLSLSKNMELTNVDASGQTATIELEYDDVNTVYKSKSSMFGPGTTFGVSGVTYDSGTGAAHVATSVPDAEFDSSFSAPITFGKSKASGNLTGTITFKKNQVVIDVKGKNVGDVVQIKNDTTNHPYGETTDWIILSKSDEEATLITKNMVTARQYHPSTPYPTWPKSDIRGWLNSAAVSGGTDYTGTGYLDTLGKDLKQVLKEESLQTAQAYNAWGTMNTSTDKVYLLTETWENSSKVAVNPSSSASSLMTTDQMKCSNTCDETGKTASYWWLRSPRFYDDAYASSRAGEVRCSDGGVVQTSVTFVSGVRPAITITLK